jgi:hypothetical protein
MINLPGISSLQPVPPPPTAKTAKKSLYELVEGE